MPLSFQFLCSLPNQTWIFWFIWISLFLLFCVLRLFPYFFNVMSLSPILSFHFVFLYTQTHTHGKCRMYTPEPIVGKHFWPIWALVDNNTPQASMGFFLWCLDPFWLLYSERGKAHSFIPRLPMSYCATEGLIGEKKGTFYLPKLCHDLIFQTSKPKIFRHRVSKLFKLALIQVRNDFQGGFINV